MAGVVGWSKNGIGKSRRSRNRASTPSRFFRCCKIQRAGFSEKRPSRLLPTMTEMTVMLLILVVGRKRKGSHGRRLALGACSAERPAHAVRITVDRPPPSTGKMPAGHLFDKAVLFG